MNNNLLSFWFPGLLSVILVGMSLRFQWLQRFEFINELISKPSVPGLIATTVLTVVVWVLFALFLRYRWASKEFRIITNGNLQLSQKSSEGSLSRFVHNIEKQHQGSLLQRRFQLILQNWQGHSAIDKVSILLGGQSSIDSAYIHSGYGPLRALIWALPGLGFMGTAYEMAASIGGLGVALTTTQDYSGLRNLLVSNVVPHLAGAFDITLFALGSSVAMFLLMSLAFHGEEKTIFEADALCLKFISRIQDTQIVPSNAIVGENISNDMQLLSQNLNLLSSALSQINQNNSGLYQHIGSISSSLSDIHQQITELRSSLDQDQEFILRRSSR